MDLFKIVHDPGSKADNLHLFVSFVTSSIRCAEIMSQKMHKLLSDAALIFKFSSNLENEIKLSSELSSLQKCPDHSSSQSEASVQFT